MSHTTTINETPITDEKAILMALDELKRLGLNITVERNTEFTYFAGKREKADIVVKTPDGYYDFGLRKTTVNGVEQFEFRGDMFGGSLEKLLKPEQMPEKTCSRQAAAIGRFMQQYSRFATENQARKQGYNVRKSYIDEKTGNVQLVLVGGR